MSQSKLDYSLNLILNETYNFLKNKGYYVVLSSGLYDLIAIQPSNDKHIYNFPLLIQCRKRTHDVNRWQGFNLIVTKENGQLVFRTTDGVKIVSI